MSQQTVNMNVRHKLGWLGKLAVEMTKLAGRLCIGLPVPLLTWAISNSSYVSVNDGPWQKMKLDLRAEDVQ